MNTIKTPKQLSALMNELSNQIQKVIIGKETAVKMLITSLISGGHVLIEDVPGTGKTTLAMALSKATSLTCRRVQFTPDVMASDITGFTMYNKSSEKFEYRKGLIMTNIFIADEINRTSPKTQSSLLEAMEEKKVTVDGVAHNLPEPFMVIATENEFGYVGTFPLPEAQLDRFLLKLSLGYPELKDEMMILHTRKIADPLDNVTPVCSAEDIMACIKAVKDIHIDPAIYKYIVEIVSATRSHPFISLGASPRASLALMRAAQSCAFMDGRDYITPEDVAQMTTYVLPHRIHLTQEARVKHITVENVVSEIMKAIKPPFSGNAE
ncbi:MAG: MoxR family ATPase [Ruminiclostridium sp.]|nr:MoxR family ATPase [Ruminiclostridium sp.]